MKRLCIIDLNRMRWIFRAVQPLKEVKIRQRYVFKTILWRYFWKCILGEIEFFWLVGKIQGRKEWNEETRTDDRRNNNMRCDINWGYEHPVLIVPKRHYNQNNLRTTTPRATTISHETRGKPPPTNNKMREFEDDAPDEIWRCDF